MRQIDLVIFECDGVLMDSELVSHECAVAALRSVGLDIDAGAVLRRFLGVPSHYMAKQVAAESYPVSPDFVKKLEQSIVDAFEFRLNSLHASIWPCQGSL
jgi:beta-phosphoglucomutase-like phosphatase (HAD superfamily)